HRAGLEIANRHAVRSDGKPGERVDVDRQAQLANAAVAHDEAADAGMEAAEAAVGDAVVAFGRLQDPVVGGGVLLNACHGAGRIVLSAEYRTVFVLAPITLGPNVLLTPKERVAHAVGNVRHPQLGPIAFDNREAS